MSQKESIIKINGKEVSQEEYNKLKENKTIRLKLQENASEEGVQNFKILTRTDKL